MRLSEKAKILIKRVRLFINWRGRMALSRLLREKRGDEMVIVLNYGLGDSMYGLSLLGAIREKNRGMRIKVVGSSRYKEILETYQGIDTLILYEPDSKEGLALKCLLYSPMLSEKAQKLGVINALRVRPNLAGDPDKDWIHFLKSHVFGLDEGASLTYHGLTPGKVVHIPNFDAEKNRIVLMNTYSNTDPFIPFVFYEKICSILQNEGYKIYSNIVGNQAAVPGTEPLRCGLVELFSIAAQIPLIVSIRSGILDFLIPSNINMFVLHSSKDSWEVWQLRSWNHGGKVREFLMEDTVSPDEVAMDFEDFWGHLELP